MAAGHAAFDAGSLATHMLIVKTGSVSARQPLVCFRTPNGAVASVREERELGHFGTHALLGESSASPTYSYSLWTTAESEFYVIERDEFLRAVTSRTAAICRRTHQRRWARWRAQLNAVDELAEAVTRQSACERRREAVRVGAEPGVSEDAAARPAPLAALKPRQPDNRPATVGVVFRSGVYVRPTWVEARAGGGLGLLGALGRPVRGSGFHSNFNMRAQLLERAPTPAPRELKLFELVGARLPTSAQELLKEALSRARARALLPSSPREGAAGAVSGEGEQREGVAIEGGGVLEGRPQTAPATGGVRLAASASARTASAISRGLLKSLAPPPRTWADFTPEPMVSICSLSSLSSDRLPRSASAISQPLRQGGREGRLDQHPALREQHARAAPRGFRPSKLRADVWACA
ncbi:hypothetical protein T492DRAFT_351600 [Pavlovales sp. CCMP2436]|nr:hypothetical protein T492DRAFT_351600 [Pavlovales sp. CCMP2436]